MDLIFYNGEHSVTFGGEWVLSQNAATFEGGYNSWTDWHLIPTSKPVISPPTVKIKQVDIPGVNGMLDLSSVLTGYPLYNNRTGSLSYILAPGFDYWESVKTDIMEKIQGRILKLYLSDDPGYYYQGMVWVNSAKSDAKTNGLDISYDLYPFKRSIITSTDDWLWDPFNFEIDYIHDYGSLIVDGSLSVEISDCMEPISPVFTASAAMTMAHTYKKNDGSSETRTYNLTAGNNQPGATLRPGVNTLLFTGNGTIGIEYRGGRL